MLDRSSVEQLLIVIHVVEQNDSDWQAIHYVFDNRYQCYTRTDPQSFKQKMISFVAFWAVAVVNKILLYLYGSFEPSYKCFLVSSI